MFVTGLAVFAAASFASAMAGTAGALFAARAGKGLGAAMLSPAALAIIMTAFHGSQRTKALAAWGASEAQVQPSASSSAVSSPSSATGG
jgi:MFS family permease